MHFRFIFVIFLIFDRIGAFVIQPPLLSKQSTIYRKHQSSSLLLPSPYKNRIHHSIDYVQSKSDQSVALRSSSMIFEEGCSICPTTSIINPNNKNNSSIRSSTSALFSSSSRVYYEGKKSSMKGSISQNNNESDNGTSMILRIYRATVVRFFQFLKNVITKVFKKGNKKEKDENEKDEKVATVANLETEKKKLQIKPEKLSEKYVEEVMATVVEKEEDEVIDDNHISEESAVLEEEEKEEKTDVQEMEVVEEQQISEMPSVDVINEVNDEPEQRVTTEEEIKEEVVTNLAEAEDTPSKEEVVQKIEEDIVIVDEPKPEAEKESEKETTTVSLPKGERWSISAPHIDLSANWKIVVNDKFKEDYDAYLKSLGQPALVRSIAVSIVELTTEEIIQGDQGRTLCIKGKNLRGVWERTLLSSGADDENSFDENNQEHDQIDLITADKEKVKAEAWWEEEGTVHRSYLRGIKKYGGGDFESRRYLKDDGQTLVCESVFHPKDGKDRAEIKWTFTRS